MTIQLPNARLSALNKMTRARTRLLTGVAALALCTAAMATPPDAWWNDIVNDRATNVRQELARGTDPNEADAEGLPSLMLAIRSGAWGAYDALLAHRRIDLEQQNKHGETALMYLALLGETERAEALIKRGAQVHRLGWTPLHYAASKAKIDTARMLLKHGALANAPAPDGTTPLMMAAYSGDRDMVQLLLDHGADATAINLQKLTASDWARERNHTRLAEDIDAMAARTQAEREGRAAQAPAKPAAESAAESPSSGTSRYFNLDRFENED